MSPDSHMKIVFVFQAAVHSVTQKIIFIEGEDLEAIKKATLLEFLEKLKEDEKVRCPSYRSWRSELQSDLKDNFR